MKFRKRPVVIEAWKYAKDCALFAEDGELPGWPLEAMDAGVLWQQAVPSKVYPQCGLHIKTLEGVVMASEGDWIIRGVAGELYPCKPDIFEAIYERVNDVVEV